MSVLWIAALAIGASPLDGIGPANSQPSVANAPVSSAATPFTASQPDRTAASATPAPRSGNALSTAAHDALHRWAKARGQDVVAAGRELLGVYREIVQDTKLSVSQRENLRINVRSRLMQLLPEIKHVADQNRPKTVGDAKDNVVLAQQGVGQGGMNGGNAQNNQNNADAGQDLVDLIQNTISPKSWDVNGGNCTINYWKLQHALVVRATDDVHGDISDALDQLNQAGH